MFQHQSRKIRLSETGNISATMSEMKFRYFDMEQNSINTRGKYIAFVAINTSLYGNKIWKANPG